MRGRAENGPKLAFTGAGTRLGRIAADDYALLENHLRRGDPGLGECGLGSERWSVAPASTRLWIVKEVSQFFQEMEFHLIISRSF